MIKTTTPDPVAALPEQWRELAREFEAAALSRGNGARFRADRIARCEVLRACADSLDRALAARQTPEAPPHDDSTNHWCVEVSRSGTNILTIETSMLAGKADMTQSDLEAIRSAGESLLGFAGRRAEGACCERLVVRGGPVVFCDLIAGHLSGHEGPHSDDRWWFDESGHGILRTHHPTTNRPLAPNPERFNPPGHVATCETNGHLYNALNACIFCGTAKSAEAPPRETAPPTSDEELKREIAADARLFLDGVAAGKALRTPLPDPLATLAAQVEQLRERGPQFFYSRRQVEGFDEALEEVGRLIAALRGPGWLTVRQARDLNKADPPQGATT